jgi:hypothetical protein
MRIDIILGGLFDNTLRRFVPLRVRVKASSGVGAGRGLLFLKPVSPPNVDSLMDSSLSFELLARQT